VEPLPGLGGREKRLPVEVRPIRRQPVKARVRTPRIVELDVPAERRARLAHRVVGTQIHLLVFDRPPQPLDEHVVAPSSLAVHADRDLPATERAGECSTSELAALVGVEDLRLAEPRQRFFERFDAERRLHRDRQPPRQHTAAEPVDHRRQIHEAARHRDVGDVHRPDLVGPRHC
jgi:hypothetical protein